MDPRSLQGILRKMPKPAPRQGNVHEAPRVQILLGRTRISQTQMPSSRLPGHRQLHKARNSPVLQLRRPLPLRRRPQMPSQGDQQRSRRGRRDPSPRKPHHLRNPPKPPPRIPKRNEGDQGETAGNSRHGHRRHPTLDPPPPEPLEPPQRAPPPPNAPPCKYRKPQTDSQPARCNKNKRLGSSNPNQFPTARERTRIPPPTPSPNPLPIRFLPPPPLDAS